MSDSAVFHPSAEAARRSHVKTMDEYRRLHRESLEDPATFWGNVAKQFHWENPIDPENVCSYNLDRSKGEIFIKWLEGATTNISYNLLDRNVKQGYGDKVAYYWSVSQLTF